MGIDVGTTAVKTMLIDNDGKNMVKSNVEYPLFFPHAGWAEQSPEELWQAVVTAVDRVLERFSGNRREIRALSLSTQRDTLICTDKAGTPLRNAITWMDSRSTDQCARLEREVGAARVYEITGVPVSTIWTLAFILWLREKEPDIFSKTACFGLVHDFVLRRLGAGRHFLDVSNACQTMLFDLSGGVWSDELMRCGGLTEERLPELVEPGTVVGTLDEALCRRWGMEKAALVSGGGDQQCAALGAGAISAGDVEIGIGTAANLLAVCDHPVLDPLRRMICHRAAIPGQWVLEGAMLATGKLMEWVRTELYGGAPLAEIDIDIEAHSTPGAGGLTLLPYFEGAACPHWNPRARGTLAGLTLSTGRADIARAVLEGISADIARNIDLLHQWELAPEKLLVSGGGARSRLWMQILADVSGRTVAVPKQTDSAVLGAAMLAGVGCGMFSGLHAAAGRLCRMSHCYEPRPIQAYGELIQRGETLYKAAEAAGLYRQQN